MELRSIDGFSRILQEDYSARLDDEARDSLARIRAAAQRMERLIDDLLKLSRISRADLGRTQVDMSALARAIGAELREQEPDRAVELVVEDGITASGDPLLLRVARENLLGNAWKFTGKRERARIEFGAAAQSGRMTWFVRDNGAGFDRAHAGNKHTPGGCSARFSGCTAARNSREPASALPACNGSSAATAAECGPRGRSTREATFWFDLDTEGQPKRSNL